MTTLPQREAARSILTTARYDSNLGNPTRYGPRILHWAAYQLAQPLAVASVLDAVREAEARYGLGEAGSDGSVAEIADRIIRGEGVTVRYRENRIFSKSGVVPNQHSVTIDGISSDWVNWDQPIRFGRILVIRTVYSGIVEVYRIFMMDLVTVDRDYQENV